MALCISLLINSAKAHTCLLFHHHPRQQSVTCQVRKPLSEFWSHLTSTAVLTQLLRCKLCKPSNPTLFLKQSFEQTTFKKPNIHFQLSEPEKKHCSTQSSDWQQRKESSCGTGMNEWNCGSKAPFSQSNRHLKNLRLSRKLCCFGLCHPST